MIKNLLPEDTRIAELVSAISLIFLSLGISFFDVNTIGLFAHETKEFWILALGMLGTLQFTSLVLYPKAEVLRCITAWINGSFWIWMAFSAISWNVSINDITSLILGFANLYAFVINTLLVWASWEK